MADDPWAVVKTEPASGGWNVVSTQPASSVPASVRSMMAVSHKPQASGSDATVGSVAREAALGVASGAGLPESTDWRDFTAIPGLKQMVTHPIESAKLVGGAIYDAQNNLLTRGEQERQQGHTAAGLIHTMGGMIPLVGPAAVGAGEEIGNGLQSGDPNAIAHGVGSAAGLLGTLGLGTKRGAAAVENVTSKVGDALDFARNIPADVKRAMPASVPELTGTTPKRIAELQSFPQRVENIRQSVITAERQAHTAASDKFPQFDKPIATGRMVEKPAQGPVLMDDWGEAAPKAMMPETTTFKALQEQRSNLLKDIANEKRAVMRGQAPRFDLADMAEQLNKLDDVMNQAALEQGGPEGLAKLQAARQQFGKYMEDFHNHGSPLRPILEAKPGQTQTVVNKLLNPDIGARGVEILRRYGADTAGIEQLLGQGDRPVRVATAESAKLRKAGSPEGYTVQRLKESISQATTNEMPSTAQARLPATAMRSKWPSIISEFPGANLLSPRRMTAWRLRRALDKAQGGQ